METTIVGVRFRTPGKIYYYNPGEFELKVGDKVIVETVMGPELATVVINNRKIEDSKIEKELKNIKQIATEKDIKKQENNVKDAKKAFNICKKKIKEKDLKMNLVEARYLFDRSKLIFAFTADDRIDFRELVKELAAIFRTRIELRQIGVRDQVKRIGGNGPCGRELCCCTFLNKFDAVSIKMAKEQNLSLNASKITGNCGRLMCCLRYEQNVYDDKIKKLPHIGAIVKTKEDGEGVVDNVEVLNERVRIKFKDDEGNQFYKKYPAADVKIIKDTKRLATNDDNQDEWKELEKIEKLDKADLKNSENDDM